ncbi:hypothetical protein EDC04DRAFT_2773203, partial [Pisolithus marmoratus]
MESPDAEQASMSGRWWQTRKWVVYTMACYALHVILVITYVILLVLYSRRLATLVIIPKRFRTMSLLLGYGALLVWLTQRLALRCELLEKQTLTAIHDKASAWNGLGAGLNNLWDQFKVQGATSGGLLVTVYLGGIFVHHITSGSVISVVCVGLFNSIVLLASSSFLVRSPAAGKPQTMEPSSSCGVLQVVWLSSHHREILEVIKTKTPEPSELRKAGSGITTVFGEVESEPRNPENHIPHYTCTYKHNVHWGQKPMFSNILYHMSGRSSWGCHMSMLFGTSRVFVHVDTY